MFYESVRSKGSVHSAPFDTYFFVCAGDFGRLRGYSLVTCTLEKGLNLTLGTLVSIATCCCYIKLQQIDAAVLFWSATGFEHARV